MDPSSQATPEQVVLSVGDEIHTTQIESHPRPLPLSPSPTPGLGSAARTP